MPRTLSAVWFLLLASLAATQEAAAPPLVIADGTVVSLRFAQEIVPSSAKVGDGVRFTVQTNVRVGGRVVIARGAEALGKIVESQAARRLNRSSRIGIELESVPSITGDPVRLRAVHQANGPRSEERRVGKECRL